MSSEPATSASAAHMPADLSGHGRRPGREHGHGHSLAGLIDVLDRADDALSGPRTRRPAAHRPAGGRSGAVRTVPLRSVQPAPMARPAPAPAVRIVEDVRVPDRPAGSRLRSLTRAAALWGSGPRGEYLAWRCDTPRPARAAAPTQAPIPAPAPARQLARRSRLHGLVRRLALWGAGPDGRYLAWGGAPVLPAPRRDVDPPVVLREMPSTPLIQPAAPSPAAALLPRDPASSVGSRRMPPVPRRAVAVPGISPSGPPERSRATGWPVRGPLSPAATGLVRARGDPLSCPVRGSPPPARRSRSPDSARSSSP
jgi:hypothetical protein